MKLNMIWNIYPQFTTLSSLQEAVTCFFQKHKVTPTVIKFRLNDASVLTSSLGFNKLIFQKESEIEYPHIETIFGLIPLKVMSDEEDDRPKVVVPTLTGQLTLPDDESYIKVIYDAVDVEFEKHVLKG